MHIAEADHESTRCEPDPEGKGHYQQAMPKPGDDRAQGMTGEQGKSLGQLWQATIQDLSDLIAQHGPAGWEQLVADYDEYSTREFLEQRGPDPVHRRAVHHALHDERIELAAAIVGDEILEDRDHTGARVHLDEAAVGRVREDELGAHAPLGVDWRLAAVALLPLNVIFSTFHSEQEPLMRTLSETA